MVEYVEYYQENISFMPLYWYLLKLHNKDILLRELYHYKSEFKKGVCVHGNYLKKYINIENINQKKLIKNLFDFGFIKEGYIYYYFGEHDNNFNIPLKEKYKIDKKGIESFSKETLNEYNFILLDLDIKYETIDEHIKAYLEEWKEGLIYKEGKNYLNFKGQVDTTVKTIYNKLKKYSDKSLWINKEDLSLSINEEINLFATLLYLESINTIKIKDIEPIIEDYGVLDTKYIIGFRIEILDNFYDFFKEKLSKKSSKNDNTLMLRYIQEDKYILINGIKVDLSKNQNEYLNLVLDLDILNLKVTLEDIAIEFDRNFNDLDEDKKKKEIKRYYNTFNELNKKVKLKTQIDKLFITTTDDIGFNSEYKIELI